MSSRRLSRSIVSVGCMGGVLRSHRLRCRTEHGSRARSRTCTSLALSADALTRRSMRSGRRSAVRSSAWRRRQAATAPWSPERSTSGTAHPRNSAGRVYWGYSSSPPVKLSSSGGLLVAEHVGQRGGPPPRPPPAPPAPRRPARSRPPRARRRPGGRPRAGPPPRSGRTAARSRRPGSRRRCRQLGRHLLVEAPPARRQQVERPGQVGHGLDAAEERLGHEHHAGTTAEGAVVDRAPGVVGPWRRSCTRTSSAPASTARPRMEAPQ